MYIPCLSASLPIELHPVPAPGPPDAAPAPAAPVPALMPAPRRPPLMSFSLELRFLLGNELGLELSCSPPVLLLRLMPSADAPSCEPAPPFFRLELRGKPAPAADEDEVLLLLLLLPLSRPFVCIIGTGGVCVCPCAAEEPIAMLLLLPPPPGEAGGAPFAAAGKLAGVGVESRSAAAPLPLPEPEPALALLSERPARRSMPPSLLRLRPLTDALDDAEGCRSGRRVLLLLLLPSPTAVAVTGLVLVLAPAPALLEARPGKRAGREAPRPLLPLLAGLLYVMLEGLSRPLLLCMGADLLDRATSE